MRYSCANKLVQILTTVIMLHIRGQIEKVISLFYLFISIYKIDI